MQMNEWFLPRRLGAVVTVGVLWCVSACTPPNEQGLNELDSESLDEIMLNFAASGDSVSFFANALAKAPDDPVAKRNLAGALAKAERFEEAAGYYAEAESSGINLSAQERISYADALLRVGDWSEAGRQISQVSPDYQAYDKERISAVLADIRKDWAAADQHYSAARALTVTPAAILNNWGVSKLSRGALDQAEAKFREAVSFDKTLFAAKNNLVLVRGRRGNYTLPIIPMTETEKAHLLHDLAVIALESGDTEVAEALLQRAVDVHPQYFEAAATKLSGL